MNDLLDDDPEDKYHDPDQIKSVLALQNETKMVMLYLKKGFIADPATAELAASMLKSCLEEMNQLKSMNLEGYKDEVRDAHRTQAQLRMELEADDEVAGHKQHTFRMDKRIECIEKEM